jgi:ABC-type glycerol-3-phosphate transport system permease component
MADDSLGHRIGAPSTLRGKARLVGILRYVAIVAVSVLFFLPIWWMVVSAIQPNKEIFRHLSPVSWRTIFPTQFTLDNIVELFAGDFRRSILNSVYVTAITVVVGLALSTGAAFMLAVAKFPFRNLTFVIIVISFLIPFDAIAVPLYRIFVGHNLQNTYAGLVLPGVGNGLAVFLLRQFFLGVPKEICEAAMIDGMSYFSILWRIYIPLSVPALVSASLLLFVFQWQAYLWPLLIAPDPQYKVAAVHIAQFSGAWDTSWSLIFTGAVFISIIPMIVLTVLQQFFSASVASTGSK